VKAAKVLPWLLVGLLVLFVAAGCGGDDDDGDDGAAPTNTETAAASDLNIALVTDVGGLNDRGFNQLANQGLERAKTELGVEGRVFISRSNADYVPNLTTAAKGGYDLVVAVGFLMAEALDTVAKRFTDVNFAIVDFPQVALASKPTNVRGLLFKEQEVGYLVGYMAALVAEEEGADTVSTVGGQKIPPVDRFIAGYQAGAKKAVPGIKTPNRYSQDFVDQAKCKEIALAQIAAGSEVVFQVAGGCGLGALDAAKEKQVWGIGVDADQAFLGPHVLTSAQKKVDVAVFETIKAVSDDAFQGGQDAVFDIKSGGVGLGKTSPNAPQEAVDKTKEIEEQISNGEIPNIPETVG
jgi:basic membrane protein A and related proteins